MVQLRTYTVVLYVYTQLYEVLCERMVISTRPGRFTPFLAITV
jgi:hypothetical protein